MMTYEDVKTIQQLVQEAGLVYKDDVFIRTLKDGAFDDTTYGQFAVECDAISSWVVEQSKKLGHPVRVGMMSTNTPMYVRMMMGVMSGGGIAALLDPQAKEDSICGCLNKAEVDILMWEPKLMLNIENIRSRCKTLTQTIQMTEGKFPETCGGILTTYMGQKPDFCVDEKVCAAIIFTSGTTGEEKGVMLSHQNLINALFSTNHRMYSTKVSVLPMHHVFCLNADILMGLSRANTLCINGGMSQLGENILRFNPMSLTAVPMVAQALYTKMVMLAEKEGKTIAEIKHRVLGNRMDRIITGGAHLPAELVEKYEKIGIFLCQGYGMSEHSPTISTPDMTRPDKAHTAGRIVPRVKTRVVDGELQVSSPSVMMGYVNAPELTAQVITEDGWLRTGDIGYADDEGFLHITGRKKNLIILSNGENVSPEQIENLLLDHQVVEECLVYGEGTSIIAEIYPNSKYMALHNITDVRAAIADVVQDVNSRVPSYKKIGKYLIRTVALQKTGSNKILRSQRATSDMILSQETQEMRLPENELQQKLFDCIAHGVGHRDFGINTDIFDAGMDSLGCIMTLAVFLDEMNFSVELDELMKNTTIEKLEALYIKKQSMEKISLAPQPVYPLIGVQTFFAYVMKGNTTSNVTFLYRLHETVDLQKMKEAIVKAFDVHPILRNVIQPSPEGYYVNLRDDNREVNIPIHTMTKAEWEAAKEKLVYPYMYTAGEPLYHISLHDVEGEKYMFIDVAHVISDGVTLSVLIDDINSLYVGKKVEKETYTFYDYILEERRARETGGHDDNMQYFKELLDNVRIDRTILNRPGKQDLSKGQNATLRGTFAKIDREKMQRIAHKYGVSDNIVFLTAFNQCISIFSDRDDTVCTSIHNGRTDSRWARIAGCLFVTYNYRHIFSKEETLDQMFQASARQVMQTMCSHVHSLHADEMFIQYQGDLFAHGEVGGAPVEMVHMQLDSLPFHLMIHARRDGTYFYELRYWANRFEEQQLAIFLDAMDAVLSAMENAAVIHDLKAQLPANLYPAEGRYKILDRHGRIQPIGGWGDLYEDGEATGRTARILVDGTVDYLEDSGRTVMNEGLFGRLYPDQVKVEEILLAYPGITKAHAFISLVEKNFFWLTIDIETDGTVDKDALLAHFGTFGDKSLMPHKVIMDGAEV